MHWCFLKDVFPVVSGVALIEDVCLYGLISDAMWVSIEINPGEYSSWLQFYRKWAFIYVVRPLRPIISVSLIAALSIHIADREEFLKYTPVNPCIFVCYMCNFVEHSGTDDWSSWRVDALSAQPLVHKSGALSDQLTTTPSACISIVFYAMQAPTNIPTAMDVDEAQIDEGLYSRQL